MPNFALNKRVLESEVIFPEIVTNGKTTGYTTKRGYCKFPFPGTLTIDLEKVYPIKYIRFLLWDNLGEGGSIPDQRKYKYALGISEDNDSWLEIYSASEEGSIGWQIFTLSEIKYLRYIRIYGIENTKPNNKMFHIVEIEAYDDAQNRPTGYIGAEKKIKFEQKSLSESGEKEQLTSFDFAKLQKAIKQLENSNFDKDFVANLKKQVGHLSILNQNLSAIRNEIVLPVTNQIKSTNKLGIWALIITIIGLLLTIAFNENIWNFFK